LAGAKTSRQRVDDDQGGANERDSIRNVVDIGKGRRTPRIRVVRGRVQQQHAPGVGAGRFQSRHDSVPEAVLRREQHRSRPAGSVWRSVWHCQPAREPRDDVQRDGRLPRARVPLNDCELPEMYVALP
jgi:hypothetical protein